MFELFVFLFRPKYDGKHLHAVLRKQLGERPLHDTLTNIFIPTFDVKKREPTIFSSYNIERDPSRDCKLSDICIGTSAAHVFLPGYSFKNEDAEGNTVEFNLVNGGICAYNPVNIVTITFLL